MCQRGRWATKGGGGLCDPISVGEGNKVFLIRVWKPLPRKHVLKPWQRYVTNQIRQHLRVVGLSCYNDGVLFFLLSFLLGIVPTIVGTRKEKDQHFQILYLMRFVPFCFISEWLKGLNKKQWLKGECSSIEWLLQRTSFVLSFFFFKKSLKSCLNPSSQTQKTSVFCFFLFIFCSNGYLQSLW